MHLIIDVWQGDRAALADMDVVNRFLTEAIYSDLREFSVEETDLPGLRGFAIGMSRSVAIWTFPPDGRAWLDYFEPDDMLDSAALVAAVKGAFGGGIEFAEIARGTALRDPFVRDNRKPWENPERLQAPWYQSGPPATEPAAAALSTAETPRADEPLPPTAAIPEPPPPERQSAPGD